jgi:hypothetical protein
MANGPVKKNGKDAVPLARKTLKEGKLGHRSRNEKRQALPRVKEGKLLDDARTSVARLVAMKTLPTTFGSDNFDFQQLRREGDIAIYVKQKPGFSFRSYEVVMIQKRNAYTWPDGQTTPAHEAMPSSRDWGKYGWTYPTLEDCQLRFKSIAEAQLEGVALGHN